MSAFKLLFLLANIFLTIPTIRCQSGPTRWGIVSAGLISNDFATVVKSMNQSEHQIVAIAARSLSSAQEFANKYNISKAYGSYEELAKDNNVQVVYVGAINPVHKNITLLMLEHGKHLLVEKPLAMNEKEAKEMIAMARASKLFLMEALWTRYLPSYNFMLDQIRAGVIGDVYYVYTTFGVVTNRDRLVEKDLGGGTILDLGVYTINLAQMVYKDETSSSIKAVGRLNADGVDLSMAAVLLYSNGRTATIATDSFIQLPNEALIAGTNGTIVVVNKNKIRVNDVEHQFPFPSTGPLNYGSDMSGFRYEIDEVRRCLLSGQIESERMTHNNSLLVASIEDELRRQIGVVYDVD